MIKMMMDWKRYHPNHQNESSWIEKYDNSNDDVITNVKKSFPMRYQWSNNLFRDIKEKTFIVYLSSLVFSMVTSGQNG